MLEIAQLKKSYAGNPVLDGVDLHVKAGGTLGIIGRGGCGKSVLLKLIAGLEHADAGSITYDKKQIVGRTEADLAPIREHMGMLFQNYALFDSLTVGDNVAFPLLRGKPMTPDVAVRVDKILTQVGLPNTETLVPSALSGGMKKRVGLARALIAEPALLLLDEPSAGLDPVSTRTVNELIDSLRTLHGFTSIVSSFDFDTIRDLVDSVAVLHEGRIHFQGTPKEIDDSHDPLVRHLVDGTEVLAV